MNSFKKALSLVLAFIFVMSCAPATLFTIADSDTDANTINVGYYSGMTLEELVSILNISAGLPEDTPAESWQWYAKGEADYEYGRYLVDVKYKNDLLDFEIDRENINFLRALEVYKQYLNGEITEEELKNDYPDVDFVFNSININHVELEAQINDALDQAERNFRKEKKYVSLAGVNKVIKGKVVELDPATDPHCMYGAKIVVSSALPAIETKLSCPTRLEVNGTEKYASILEGIEKGDKIQVRNGDREYTVNVYGIARSEIVLKAAESYIYPISFNAVAGDDELDILERIYAEVVDFEASTLADDFDMETKNGFTVRFYDNKTGWYEFEEGASGRLVAGEVYEVEMIYEGDTTDSVEFKIAVYDPRKAPTIAIYKGETLVIQKTDIETIKEEIFNNLIDKSDLPADVEYTDFDYYYFVGDYSAILDHELIAKVTDTNNSNVKKYSDMLYDKLWELSEKALEGTALADKFSKEEIKEQFFTVDYLRERLAINEWLPIDGGYYPITIEFEGEEIELFQIELPELVAGFNYQIKASYKGDENNFPAEAVSEEKTLQIVFNSSTIDVVDGAYLKGTGADGFVEVEDGYDYATIGVQIDPNFLSVETIFVGLPEEIRGLLTVKYGERTVDPVKVLETFLATRDYTLSDVVDLLAKLDEVLAAREGADGRITTARSYIEKLEKAFDKLPVGTLDAKVRFDGLPTDNEGIYLVAAAIADLDCMPFFDYGVCFIVNELDREYAIEFDNEIPEGFGLAEGEEFDFSAHVYNAAGEPFEENPEAYSFFIGHESGSGLSYYFSTEAPTKKGQYVQISTSDVANPTFRYFEIGLMASYIESPGDEFEYDGMPHGAPIITDAEGNILPLGKNDEVIYTNLVTNDVSRTAPSKVGIYSVMVIYSGDADHKGVTGTYEFKIVPKTINVWVDEYTTVYGDELPAFEINCDVPELLSKIEYTVTPNAAYTGNVGTHTLIINILSVPEGYKVAKTEGVLNVVPREVTIKMEDITLPFGDDYDPDDSKYYSVVEGSVIEGDILGLTFEKFTNAGVYDYAPTGHTNTNYIVNTIKGKITIIPKSLELTIKDAFIFEGEDLPEFEFIEECPEDLRAGIHIAPAYYDGEVGEYTIIGVNENPNYNVTINDGTLYVKPRPATKVTVSTSDYSIVYGDELPEFRVETSVDVDDVTFTVQVEEYAGNVGVYALNIIPSAYDGGKYEFTFEPGTLTVTKKDLTIKVKDYETVYGTEFDPDLVYVFECADPTVSLEGIFTYHKIGAENFNGDAGSYLLIGKAASDNYNITVESGTLTVNPKPIVIVPTEGQGKFEGEEDGEITYETDGLVGEDVLEGALSRVEGEEIGLYEILLGTLSNSNYTLTILEELYAIRSKDYQKIVINKLPDNVTYLQGTDFDPTGMEVVAITAEGDEVALEYGVDYQVLGYDSSLTEVQELTVYFKGHMAKFEVVVMPSEVSVIKVDELPEKLIYIEGQEFDPTGISVVVFYDNGTYKYIDPQYLTFTGYDMSVVGTQNVTVEFGGATDSFEITVIEKGIAGIEVDTTNVKTEYVEGMEFTTEGLKVYAVYNNGVKVELTPDRYTVSGFEADKIGTQTITVKFVDFTTTYEVTLVEKKAVSIELVYDGNELSVVLGCDFDPAQLVVIATFNDGTTEVIPYGEYIITGYNNNEIGIQASAVEFDGVSVDVLVRVIASSIESIEIVTGPDKNVYILGEELDLTGMEVFANINNGTTEEVFGFVVRNYDPYKLGTQNLEVSYLGYKTTLKVTVVEPSFEGIEITALPDKTVFIEGTEIDITGLKVVTISENRIEIPVSELTISEVDTSVVGVHTVTVEYAGKTAEFEIEIVEKTAVSIKVDLGGKYIITLLGGAPILEGIVAEVEYDNGTTEQIAVTEEMLTALDNTAEGRTTALVEYKGVTTEVPVWVVKALVEEIIITKYPDTLKYPEGIDLDATGMEILVKYEGGISEYITGEDCDLVGYDKTLVGVQTVTVVFANAEAYFDVEVTAKKLEKIEITELPAKTEFVYSQALDLEGIVVVAYYDNGEYFVVETKDLGTKGYSAYTYGTQTVSVIYAGLKATYEVVVIARAPIGIEVDSTDAVKNYYLGNKLVTEGLKVYLVYNDGSLELVETEACSFSGFASDEVGTYVVGVAYNGFEAEYEVEVLDVKPVDIIVELGTMNTVTVEGTPHSFDEMTVIARYANGEYREIAYGAYTVEDYDYEKYGTYDAKVVFGECESALVLTVLPGTVGIEITTLPEKLEYIKGQSLDTTGLVVSEVKSDGTRVPMDLGDVSATADLSKAGEVEVTVSALGYETTYGVKVYGYTAEDIFAGVDGKFTAENGYIIISDLGNTTTLGELKAALNGGKYLVAKDEVGNVLSDDTVVTTGMAVTFEDGESVYNRFTVIVKGDIDGNGILDITDAVTIFHSLSGDVVLSEIQKIAADVVEEGETVKVNITDAVCVFHTING